MTLFIMNGRNLHFTGWLRWPDVGKQLENTCYFHLTTES